MADKYLADRYAGEHLAGRYMTSGDVLVDRLRTADEDTDGRAAEHDSVLDAEDLKRRGRLRWALTALTGLPVLSGRAFAAVTVAPALLAMAWLLPGTGMLLAGRLRAVPMVIIFIPLAVALCYFAMERLPLTWPRFSEAEPDAAPAAGRPKAGVPAVALLAMLVIAAGFGVWQAVYRSEQVFGTSDPGVYLQYGYWIAGHGTARIPVSAAAFGSTGGGATGLNFATPGFTVSGSSITPSFLPGLPLVLAGGAWFGGLSGALLVPAVLGGCAVLSFAGLVGRLCGAWWGVAGELVLAVSLPEVYASRAPFSEPLVQVLLFGGLCLFIDSLVVRRRVLALLGGLALGLTVLASIASLGMLLPAFPFLAALFVARRPQTWPFGAGLVLGLGTGLVTGRVLAHAYLSSLSAQLQLIGLCAFGSCALTVLTLALAVPAIRAWVRRVFAYHVRVIGFKGEVSLMPSLGGLAQWLALVLPVAVLIGLAERPYLQTVRGQTDPAMIRAVAALQRFEGLPVDGLRQYYESSLHWMLWYLGAPALLLACAGAAALGRRSVEAVLEGRSRDSAAPASVPSSAVLLCGLPFAIVAWSVVTVLWAPSVVPWQPMASHRLVPVVLPGLVLFGVWMSSWLTSRTWAFGASRTALTIVGACCVLALALPALVTTLNPGLSKSADSAGAAKLMSRVQLRGVGAAATYGGSIAAASALCAAIGPSASVLVTDASTAATFAPVVRGLCGQPAALVVSGPSAAGSAAVLEQAVRSVEQAGRRPVLLGSSRSSVSLPGSVPQQVVSLRTAGDAESLTEAPTGTWPVTYTAWLAVPTGTGT
ncbi:MAG TPA: hypothetical protein VN714_08185 [Trebonia sp.]|nr:hypothetical protein [Trebonia sp.]